LFWTISAKCTVTSPDADDNITGDMKKGSGKLNGQNVGSGLTLDLKNNSELDISASAFASVEIVNKGANTMHAGCSLASNDIDVVRQIVELVEEIIKLKNY